MRKVAIAALAGLALMAGQAVAANDGASRNVADRVGSAKGPATSNATPAVVRVLNTAKSGGTTARQPRPCGPFARCVPPRSRGPRQ